MSRLLGAVLACTVGMCLSAAPADIKPETTAHPSLWPQAHTTGLVDDRTERFVTDLIARMSLEEKIGQMIQADVSSIKPDDLRQYPLGSILAGGNSPPLSGNDRGPPQDWLATTRGFHQVAAEQRRGHVAIPVIFGIDAVHGNSNVKGATVFPHNVGLGAAHDPALVRRIAEVTAQETAAVGVDWAFAPTLAVPRDKRWGRTYEGFSEDPALVKQYASAMVLGLQGEAGQGRLIQRGLVAATAKHFLGDGGTTDGIDQGNAEMSEQELIDIHAQAYPAAINAGVMTVMVSYSSWNGAKMHGNRSLITDVLKGRMGFEGFVVSDWNGHGQVPGCKESSCPAAYNAGIDMIMAPDDWKELFTNTLEQVRSGVIPMSRVDDAVRRILRVKARLGLFESDRPWDGKLEVLGSAEHRAVAREAVRKSLVLLKNNDHVLPIKANAHVLVTGESADDIGRQSGGWTLSWQGTGNSNADFPHGQSIYAGIKEAIERAGGSVELSTDSSFKTKPDVIIAVFGEEPTAEMRGDLPSIDYQVEHPNDLSWLKKLKADGVPLVSVFLSGRPLWVNPLINQSDAFVAAWFPGSEGAGIADVLVGDTHGKPRYDFTGKLSMSWPNSAAQAKLNVGDQDYAPLFAYGYGLNYASHKNLSKLSEASVVTAMQGSVDKYFLNGRTFAPWRLALRHHEQMINVPDTAEPFSLADVIAIAPTDAGGIQEGGKQITWTGQGTAAVLIAGAPVDLSPQANADMSLQIEYRVDRKPSRDVALEMSCGRSCYGRGALRLTPVLKRAPPDEWQTLKIKLSCFRDAGADLPRIAEPMVIVTAGQLQLSIGNVRLTADSNDAVCLKAMNGYFDDV